MRLVTLQISGKSILNPGLYGYDVSDRGTSPLKARARGFNSSPSGRKSRRARVRSMFTPGSRVCAYKTASGRREWPNRDPVSENGFWTLTGQLFLNQDVAGNPYTFVSNEPLGRMDSLGLQDGQTCTDRCKERCHDWANALAAQGGFESRKALQNCYEGCDRNPNYIPGSPIPPLPTMRPRPPKEPWWPLIKSCAKLVWEWCKDRNTPK